MPLRPYQLRAVEAIQSHILESTEPIVAELATGAGKSHIISAVAEWIHSKSKKPVLVLQPSKELVEQNHSKYPTKASIYCASAGQKCLEYPVVFASPLSIRNAESQNYAAIILDEADLINPTIIKLINSLKLVNPKIRIIGLTATPYRTGEGFIYEIDLDNELSKHIKPYFKKLVARVTANELIKLGYLTPPLVDTPVGAYEVTENLDTVTIGKGRLTAQIVKQVVRAAANCRGVMLFASTIDHALEIQASIPGSRVITGDMKKKDRSRDIDDFKAQKYKYIISVGTLTTGFDCPHVDLIAVLRATDSARLFQQIIGRGTRLYDGKKYFIVMDFAGNIERHGLEDDLFNPEVEAYEKKPSHPLEITCPLCNHINEFGKRQDKEYEDFAIDDSGNFVDLAGNTIQTEHGPMIAHYGRRCKAFDSKLIQCEHRWTHKKCLACKYENDITARKCQGCKCELIDPNDKLLAEFKKMKKNPREWSTDKVLEWSPCMHKSGKGNQSLQITYKTEYRTFKFWYKPGSKTWDSLCNACYGKVAPCIGSFLRAYYGCLAKMPQTVTVVKRDKWFRISGHNQNEDTPPDQSIRQAS